VARFKLLSWLFDHPNRSKLRGIHFKIRHVNNLKINDDQIPRVSSEKAEQLSMYKLELGDIVFSRVGSVGRVALTTEREKGWLISGQMLRLRIKNPLIYSEYLIYLISSVDVLRYFELASLGSTRDSINTEILRDMPVLIPPLPEQRAIAAFLGREIAKIDALVEKKQRLIGLLEEKRAAIISHAVTKGLDPDVPMKDSGVEWLGEIPAGWNVGELFRNWQVIDCKHRTATYVYEGIPIVSTTEVKPGRLNLKETRVTTYEEYLDLTEGDRLPKRGDIIYTRNASLGSAAYVDTDEAFCMGQDVCLITSSDQDQLFLTYQVNSSVILQQLEALMVGATFRRINVGQIKKFIVVRPPIEDQKLIAEYLDRISGDVKALILKIHEAINKLQEYRTALISAAVTGKIDVWEASG